MKDITYMALNLVGQERVKQDEKWGDEHINHLFKWMSILMEEVGELAEAANESCIKTEHTKPEKGGRKAVLKEAVHVAAVAVSIIEAVLQSYEENFPEALGEKVI